MAAFNQHAAGPAAGGTFHELELYPWQHALQWMCDEITLCTLPYASPELAPANFDCPLQTFRVNQQGTCHGVVMWTCAMVNDEVVVSLDTTREGHKHGVWMSPSPQA